MPRSRRMLAPFWRRRGATRVRVREADPAALLFPHSQPLGQEPPRRDRPRSKQLARRHSSPEQFRVGGMRGVCGWPVRAPRIEPRRTVSGGGARARKLAASDEGRGEGRECAVVLLVYLGRGSSPFPWRWRGAGTGEPPRRDDPAGGGGGARSAHLRQLRWPGPRGGRVPPALRGRRRREAQLQVRTQLTCIPPQSASKVQSRSGCARREPCRSPTMGGHAARRASGSAEAVGGTTSMARRTK